MTTRRRFAPSVTGRFGVLLCLALLVTDGALTAQNPPARPTFRTGTNAVVVDARVVDSSGRFISDLTQDEFKVFEDGHEQIITTFALVDLPLPDPPATQSVAYVGLPSDVTSNVDADGRLYVIVLDDYNPTHPFDDLSSFREPAQELIYHMTPSDRAAIVTTAGRRDMAQEFTNDRGRLLATLDRFTAGNRGQTDVPVGMAGPIPNPFDPVQDAMYTLKDIANWLSGVPARRKAIVLVSGRMAGVGASLTLTNFSKAKGLQDVSRAKDLRDLVAATSRANTSIYVLNPTTAQPHGFDPGEYVMSLTDPDPDARVTIAQATGGFTSAGNFDGVFERIASESGSYYLLGYSSPTPNDDGKFHRIEVRTTRGNLGVRTRTGYYAKEGKPLRSSMVPTGMSPALVEALQSPASVSGLPMSMSVAPYRGKGSTALVSIAIEIDPDNSDGAGAIDKVRAVGKPIEVAIAAAKVDGKVSDLRTIAVPGGTIVARMELSPGRYHLRAAGLDTSNNRRGSLLFDIDVPDFSRDVLTMSGIVMAVTPRAVTSDSGQRWVSGSDERWKKALGAPPTTRRVFDAEDDVMDYVEVYGKRAGGQIAVTTTVRTHEGDILFSDQETVSVDPVKGMAPLHAIKTRIPLTAMPPGSYVLKVEARVDGAEAPVSRTIPFSVR